VEVVFRAQMKISLAHHGVLFLDEQPELDWKMLEVLH
jgi:predicted ATPase with chaperone activity